MEESSSMLSLRQRWTMTILILSVAAVGATDIITDYLEGAASGHMVLESMGLLLACLGVAWIWMENRSLSNRTANLNTRLAAANEEAKAWRAKTQTFVQGLGKALDDQFSVWSLSAAEKEVALLLLKGLSLKEIAAARGTQERTTRQQAQEIYKKSNLAGRAEFAAFFLEDLLAPQAAPPSRG